MSDRVSTEKAQTEDVLADALCHEYHPPGTWDSQPGDMFALDADVTIYWPTVRPCWEERSTPPGVTPYLDVVQPPETGLSTIDPDRSL